MYSNNGLQLITTSVGETWASKSKDSAVILSSMQWWDPGFQRRVGEGAIPKVGRGCQPIIDRFFPENCMKMKDNRTESSEKVPGHLLTGHNKCGSRFELKGSLEAKNYIATQSTMRSIKRKIYMWILSNGSVNLN